MLLAGDHVRCDLPVALMERAATTGFQAANSAAERWGLAGHDLWTVPDAGPAGAAHGDEALDSSGHLMDSRSAGDAQPGNSPRARSS